MSENGGGDDGDRNEAPTPKKRQDARDKGEIPKSQELNVAFGLIAGALLVQLGGGLLGRGLQDMMGHTLLQASLPAVGLEGIGGRVIQTGWRTLWLLTPVLLAATAVTLFVAGAQGRGVLTAKPLEPKWSKLNPLSNAKNVWGTRAVAELGKSFLKLGVLGTVLWLALRGFMGRLPSLIQQSPAAMAREIHDTTVILLASAGGAYLVVAGADYAYQLWQHEKKLKMSKEEIRKEFKESEGDPHVKSRLRSMGRAMARKRMLTQVATADVIITNPTHVAVALKYDPSIAPAPVVLAMGERKVAERIKQIAADNGVPRVENVPLARALLRTARVGQAIPAEFYVAVAEVLAFVMKQKGRTPGRGGNRRTGGSGDGGGMGGMGGARSGGAGSGPATPPAAGASGGSGMRGAGNPWGPDVPISGLDTTVGDDDH